jgi:hypothetical protein
LHAAAIRRTAALKVGGGMPSPAPAVLARMQADRCDDAGDQGV